MYVEVQRIWRLKHKQANFFNLPRTQALLLLVRILIQFYFVIWPSLIPAGEQKLTDITISTKRAYFIYSM